MGEWVKTAKVGDKVQCVRPELAETNVEFIQTPVFPVVGKVYTIRQIAIGTVFKKPCLRLEEIADQWVEFQFEGRRNLGDVMFSAVCFRPLQSRPADISVFRDMLKTAPAPVEETV
jgi:hypothetical protein